MANRLITIEEASADFSRTCQENGISEREAFEVIAYAAASAYDEDEQRQVRKILGLEGN